MKFYKRRSLVEDLSSKGVENSRVLEAFLKVPRHVFVSKQYEDLAYKDIAIPISNNQTTSQPYVIAKTLEHININGKDEVLEIGTGSGYQTAVLSEIAQEVYTIEKVKELMKKSKKTLKGLGYKNIKYRLYKGSFDLFKRKFDKIIVSAKSKEIPKSLLDLLTDDGVLIIPVGSGTTQDLTKVTKTKDGINKEVLMQCSFVPLKE